MAIAVALGTVVGMLLNMAQKRQNLTGGVRSELMGGTIKVDSGHIKFKLITTNQFAIKDQPVLLRDFMYSKCCQSVQLGSKPNPRMRFYTTIFDTFKNIMDSPLTYSNKSNEYMYITEARRGKLMSKEEKKILKNHLFKLAGPIPLNGLKSQPGRVLLVHRHLIDGYEMLLMAHTFDNEIDLPTMLMHLENPLKLMEIPDPMDLIQSGTIEIEK